MSLIASDITVENLFTHFALRHNPSIQATANTTTTLSVSSKHLYIYTGSVSGQILKLGDATTYLNGHEYFIYNNSSATIKIIDNSSNLITLLGVHQGVFVTLENNSTSTGVWNFSLFNKRGPYVANPSGQAQFMSVDDVINNDNGGAAVGWGIIDYVATQTGNSATLNYQTATAQNRPGFCRFTTGTTNTGRVAICSKGLQIVQGGGLETYECEINLTQLATVAQDFIVRFGTGDQDASVAAGTDHNNGAYFEYQGSAQANWVIKTANGGTRTTTVTSTAVATGYVKLQIICTDGTKVDYFINGTNVGTITTNLPTVNPTAFCIKMEKKAGTTAVTMDMDYFSHSYQFGTSR